MLVCCYIVTFGAAPRASHAPGAPHNPSTYIWVRSRFEVPFVTYIYTFSSHKSFFSNSTTHADVSSDSLVPRATSAPVPEQQRRATHRSHRRAVVHSPHSTGRAHTPRAAVPRWCERRVNRMSHRAKCKTPVSYERLARRRCCLSVSLSRPDLFVSAPATYPMCPRPRRIYPS